MRRHISQREAHRLQRRVKQLESEQTRRKSRWVSDYPGPQISSVEVPREVFTAVEAVKRVGLPVVAVIHDYTTGKVITFHADKG